MQKEQIHKLRRFIKGKIDNPLDAEDILQETLISAYQSLGTFNGRSSFYTWICAIAKHEIGDFYRKKRIKAIVFSRLPFLEGLVSQALGPELALERKEVKEKVRLVLGNLKKGYEQVLRLKYIEEMTVREIARELGETMKAVEARLFRARVVFRREFRLLRVGPTF